MLPYKGFTPFLEVPFTVTVNIPAPTLTWTTGTPPNNHVTNKDRIRVYWSVSGAATGNGSFQEDVDLVIGQTTIVQKSATNITGESAAINRSFSRVGLTIRFVRNTATGANDGSSWEDAYIELQNAIDLAVVGNELWVAQGTYISAGGADKWFLISKNISLYGGFLGAERRIQDRPVNGRTALSGNGTKEMVLEVGAQNNVDGFDIGWARSTALNIYAGNPIFTNCRIHDNIQGQYQVPATYPAGARINEVAIPIFNKCIFENNEGQVASAVMAYVQDPPVANIQFNDCIFRNNKSYDPDVTTGQSIRIYSVGPTFQVIDINRGCYQTNGLEPVVNFRIGGATSPCQ